MVNITEAASQERRVIYEILQNGILSNEDYFLYGKLISEQETYFSIFQKMLDKHAKEKLQQILNSCSDCIEINKFRTVIKNKSIKNEIIANVYRLSGFGGLIDNYNNYLLKGNEEFTKKIQRYHSSILRELNKYRRIKGISKEEKKLIKRVKNIFDEYMGYTLDIQDGYRQNRTIESISSSIAINSSEAIKALDILNNTIYGADYKKWFEVSTKRVEYLKDYGTHLSKDIKEYIENRSAELINSSIITFVVVFTIILIVFIVSSMIIKKIVKQLNIFKDGFEYSFQYVIREKEVFKTY